MTVKGSHEGNIYLEYLLGGKVAGKRITPSFATDTEKATQALEIFLSRMRSGQTADPRQMQRYENLCNGRRFAALNTSTNESHNQIIDGFRDTTNRDNARIRSGSNAARRKNFRKL